MGGIFSCFTRQSPVALSQSVQEIANKAGNAGRVSTSNLNNLLKNIQNSPEQLTLSQYREIQDGVEKIDTTLKNQHSKRFAEKNAKITTAYNLACQKLNPQAQTERMNEAKKSHTAVINEALDIIKRTIPQLMHRVNVAKADVDSTIRSLPTIKSQKEAIGIIDRKHYTAFGEEAAVTHSLFPSRREQVERRNGFRTQTFDHPDKSTWTSLESKGLELASAKAKLSKAKEFLGHGDNFTFNKPDSTGKLELTTHQQALLKFAQQYN